MRWLAIKRAHSRKLTSSIGSTHCVTARLSTQDSISRVVAILPAISACNSQKTTDGRKTSRTRLFSHARIAWCGRVFRVSEMTVSNRKRFNRIARVCATAAAAVSQWNLETDLPTELLSNPACRTVETTPFFNGHENGGFHTAPSDDLRTFLEAAVQEFAETGLGILNLPRHEKPPACIHHKTSQLAKGTRPGLERKKRGRGNERALWGIFWVANSGFLGSA
jgi:hypothetical protein